MIVCVLAPTVDWVCGESFFRYSKLATNPQPDTVLELLDYQDISAAAFGPKGSLGPHLRTSSNAQLIKQVAKCVLQLLPYR